MHTVSFGAEVSSSPGDRRGRAALDLGGNAATGTGGSSSSSSSSLSRVRSEGCLVDVDTESTLWRDLLATRADLRALQLRVDAMTEDQSLWSSRYSRIMCTTSNLLVGTWVFISRFISLVRKKLGIGEVNLRDLLSGTAGAPPTQQGKQNLLRHMQVAGQKSAKVARNRAVSSVVYKAYNHALLRCSLFFVSAYLLSRPGYWKPTL